MTCAPVFTSIPGKGNEVKTKPQVGYHANRPTTGSVLYCRVSRQPPSRGCRKKHKSLEPRSTRRTQRKRKALLSALRVLRGSLLFRDFCDAHLRGYPNSRHGLVDKKWVSFSLWQTRTDDALKEYVATRHS